jgi:cyclohexadienyl dehydratase
VTELMTLAMPAALQSSAAGAAGAAVGVAADVVGSVGSTGSALAAGRLSAAQAAPAANTPMAVLRITVTARVMDELLRLRTHHCGDEPLKSTSLRAGALLPRGRTCDADPVKRFAPVVCLVVLLASAVSACQQQAGGSDLDRIMGSGVVRVCSTGDYQPFSHRDPQGRWSGLDIDLADDLATRLAVRLDLVPTTWASLMKDLDDKCDLAMGGITITADRAKQARFSSPYLHDGKAAAVRCADVARYRSLADVDRAGVRVVVNPGGTNADFDHANLKHATVVEYPDNNTIFGQLIGGQADVMITDASEIRWQTSRNPQLCGVAVDQPFTSTQKAYLIPAADEATLKWVDQWLTTIVNDGTYATVSRRWLGRVVGPT